MEDKRIKILVVDDEPAMVTALKQFFSARGYAVLGAFSGEEALGILEKERADVILLDIMMPGLKGTEVARIVKEKYPSVKLILVTGYPEEGKKIATNTLLDGLFIKPIGINELYTKLVDVLGGQETALKDSGLKKGIRARVLLLKAKLLFVEPSSEFFGFLSSHFKGMASRGENYEVEVAPNIEECRNKLTLFNPDILVINMSGLDASGEKDVIEKVYQSPHKPKETIIYNLTGSQVPDQLELERLTKLIQTFCFKNGLIEVRWVEI